MVAFPTSRHQAGFSFIELLASLAILALMATVALPLAEKTVQRSKEHELRRALRDIRQAIDAYKRAVDELRAAAKTPPTVPDDTSGYPPTLMDLVNGVTLVPGTPKRYFLRRLPRDPFNLNDKVSAADSWGVRSFDSAPTAPARGADVFDVYSLSEQKGLNGVAYKDW